MNTKYILENDSEQLVYCVVRQNEPIQKEFEKVLSIRQGYGMSVKCSEKEIRLIDYFAAETRAIFKIISIEQTSEELQYYMKKIQ